MVPVEAAEPDQQVASLAETQDPTSLEEAFSGLFTADWKAAIIEEFQAHIENGTWEIINRPKDRGLIGSRFVLKSKLNGQGSLTEERQD